jgi:hypothetical protein
LAKKSSKPPASIPTTSKIIARIAKTRAAIQAAALARALPAERPSALKKEGNPKETPG